MRLELAVGALALAIAVPVTYLLRLRTKPGRGPQTRPRVGGFSIVAAFVLSPAIMALFSEQARQFITGDWPQFLALSLCGFAVFAMGARDDFRDVDWRWKMGVQAIAAAALYVSGYHVGKMTLPGGDTVALGVFDPLVTIVWLVLITNAVNLIDGKDGVAAGVAVLVSGTMAYVAWDLGHDLIAMLFAALTGAALGFVPFNLPSARRWLGDSGTYFLGFTIGGLSVAGFVDTTGRVPLYIPLVALGLPVLETGVAFLRRILDGRNPFAYDQDHFHDRIERLFNLKPIQVTFVAYGLAAVFCGAALLAHAWYQSAGSAVVGAGVLIFAIVLIATLGYVTTMWRSLRAGNSRRQQAAAKKA